MRALALFSGGLDSTLAMKLIVDQGIEVIAINVNMGFGGIKDRKAHLENMCRQVGAKLEILDVRKEYLDEVLFSPQYGYGSAFNPCIDCHGFMFRHTKKLLEKYNASFMISGEVMGQRPMSQRREALDIVKKISDDEDLIVRPLCAKHLPITKPEREGWIDREKLLDIEGRSRSRQMEMAKEFGITDYEKPAGGCMLTENNTALRIGDFVKHEGKLEVEDINILKYGRHLRLPNGAKMVIGRNQEDNEALRNTNSNKFDAINLINITGPYSLLSKNASKEDKELATKIAITYAKTSFGENYTLKIGEEVFEGTPEKSKDFTQQYLLK